MTRPATAVDSLAEAHLDHEAAHNPLHATYLGLPGHDHELPAFDPGWYAARSAHRLLVRDELDRVEAVDAVDRITIAALRDDIDTSEALREIGAEESQLNNIDSPVQSLRDVFDLMTTDTADHWSVIAARMAALPDAIDGYLDSLRWAAERGHVSARRQVEAGARQCDDNVGADGFFATFARDARPADGGELPDSVRADLERSAVVAGEAYARLAGFLREEMLPQAPSADAVGRERYAPFSRYFVRADVDIDETYEWGQQQVAAITGRMAQLAEQILPGASVREAMDHLDADPARRIEGADALQLWMQGKSDAAVAALAGTHFDIPEPIRRLECRIAPTNTGGIYYTGPSGDLVTRPGRMWWSVPEGQTTFSTWSELTTVYHEGVPGHHLQVAQTTYRSAELNRWRRLASWSSGHGEGWALYAEQLMADLGFLEDPANLLGMLDSQSLRAARVVIDIGLHCELPAPAEVGGGAWDYDKAFAYLSAHNRADEGLLRFETERYLGWPGQAPSYAIGQRLWTQLRDEVRRREGDAFDLKAFHRRALDLGGIGLDVLRRAVLGDFD